MRKINITLFLLVLVSMVFAQNSNLVVFSEGGESFTLILNGVKRNEIPQTNVKVTDLPEAPYKAKIIFEDRSIPPLDKNLYTTASTETTYNITRKKKTNELTIRVVSQNPISEEPKVVKTETAPVNNKPVVESTTVTTTTIDNTTPQNNNTNNGFSMNVNINDGTNGENIGMNVNINDNMGTTNTNTTYTETTTTTTTTTSSFPDEKPVNTSSEQCDYPMDNSDFLDGKKSIESKTFADSKITVAKQITKAHCPTAEQIRDFTKLFTFESGKLEYAKFAYDYCYDKGNYYKVNDAFDFESSIDDLNEYVEGR